MAQQVQDAAHKQITAIVTACLQHVFGPGLAFHIHFERKRGKTAARMVFLQGGQEVDPAEADSGGAVDVAAFGLRLAGLLLSRPARRKLLVLDEPFKHVSAGHTAAVRGMVEAMAKDFGVQFLIVTHNTGLKAGTVVALGEDEE